MGSVVSLFIAARDQQLGCGDNYNSVISTNTKV